MKDDEVRLLEALDQDVDGPIEDEVSQICSDLEVIRDGQDSIWDTDSLPWFLAAREKINISVR